MVTLEDVAKALKIEIDANDLKAEMDFYRSIGDGFYTAKDKVLTFRIMSRITELVEKVDKGE